MARLGVLRGKILRVFAFTLTVTTNSQAFQGIMWLGYNIRLNYLEMC